MEEILAKKNTQTYTFEELSPTASRFIKRYPNLATSTLENVARKYRSLLFLNDLPEELKPFLKRKSGESLIDATEVAKILGVSRSTVYSRARKGLLLSWYTTKKELKFPKEQIHNHRVVHGIDQVAKIIGDPELTWDFLNNKTSFAGDFARPIDLLNEGRIKEVLGTAKSYGTAPT